MLIDRDKAIEAIRSMIVSTPGDYDTRDTVSYQDTAERAAEVIGALPPAGVTDEMCLEAGNVFHDALASGKSAPEAMRVALIAAMGA